MRILVTGANGHIGLKLIRRLNRTRPEAEIVAAVRSERAATALRNTDIKATIRVVDYTDASGISAVAAGCEAIVHLVGIIRESAANTFQMAHEAACTALVSAATDAKHIVHLGILGSSLSSGNACLCSRARAEAILQSGPVPVTVIRVPMVLGPDDYASMALRRYGRAGFALAFRAGSLEQPIYSEDVINAIVAALSLPPKNRIINLAGPESLTRADLIRRAGNIFHNRPVVLSVPIAMGYGLALMMELFARNPPVTRAMLGVLDHDDEIDTQDATELLDIELTSLDETLDRVLKSPGQ